MNALLSTTKRRHLLPLLMLALIGNPMAGAQNSAAATSISDEVVQIVVTARGLDLDRSTDAARFYGRIRSAARNACVIGGSRSHYLAAMSRQCAKHAINRAVTTLDRPLVTAAHLRATTVRRGGTPKLLGNRTQE
jgi:UrcA family protein